MGNHNLERRRGYEDTGEENQQDNLGTSGDIRKRNMAKNE